MVIYCPTDNDGTNNLTDHSQCLFIVFSFDVTFQQNWNNKPNAEANNDRYDHLFSVVYGQVTMKPPAHETR